MRLTMARRRIVSLRVATVLVAVSAVGFVVANRGGGIAGMKKVVTLGASTIILAIAVIALGILVRGAQACLAYRLVGLPARLGPLTFVSAKSYAANKVTKSGGLAGLMPHCSNARRQGRNVGR